MNVDEIVFEEPPSRKHGPTSQYEPLRKALTERPGEWARIPGTLSMGRQSGMKRVLGAGYEITARSAPDNEQGHRRIYLWARYVGEMT